MEWEAKMEDSYVLRVEKRIKHSLINGIGLDFILAFSCFEISVGQIPQSQYFYLYSSLCLGEPHLGLLFHSFSNNIYLIKILNNTVDDNI